MEDNLYNFFYKFFLLITVILSFYVFVCVLILKNKKHNSVFTAWQFPMLLAVYLEVVYDPYKV